MTTPTYTTPEALAEEYRQTGQRYIRQADAEFDKGDFLQASEKAWGAASQYLKALAVIRGMRHHTHRELRMVANQIVAETDEERIGDLFVIGEGAHTNFYEAWMPEREVRRRIDNMKELVSLLENVPPPNGDTSIRPPRARLFIRDRGDDV